MCVLSSKLVMLQFELKRLRNPTGKTLADLEGIWAGQHTAHADIEASKLRFRDEAETACEGRGCFTSSMPTFLIWFLERSPKLSPTIAGILRNPDSVIVVPNIAQAEVCIRQQCGKMVILVAARPGGRSGCGR